MKKSNAEVNSCILCDEIPEEGMHITGIKYIKGKEEPYGICKKCCYNRGKFDFNTTTEFRKKLWERVEEKLLEKQKE
jgi:hypothetical protein